MKGTHTQTTAMRWGLHQWTQVFLAVVTLSEVLILTVVPLADRAFFSNACQSIVCLVAALLLTRAAITLRRTHDDSASGWTLLAVASWVWVGGACSYTVLEWYGNATFPGIPDCFYFACYPFIICGFRQMHRKPLSNAEELNNALDLSALGLVVAVVIWHYNLKPLSESLAKMVTPAGIVSLCYVFVDLVTLMLLFGLLLRKTDHERRYTPTVLLLIGFFCLMVSDLCQGYLSIQSTDADGTLVDIGWVLFGVLTSLGALEVVNSGGRGKQRPFHREMLQTISTTILTNLWIMAGFTILVLAVFHPEIRSKFLLYGTAVAFILAVARQTRMIGENTQLYKSLRHAQMDLEQKVLDRTTELATANTSLRGEIQERRRIQGELEQQRAELLSEIEDRKRIEAEVERVHQQLLLASRQAGMAEVATGVLHNVGNVLNSVNVSANIVTQQLNRSQAANLAKVSAMFDSHRTNLSDFLTSDPKGQRLPEFITHLSIALEEERVKNVGEIQALQRNVEHIKEIVGMQQRYAKAAGFNEDLAPVSLLKDAMHMNMGAFQRHYITVKYVYLDVPLVRVDKHKVLQILINLLRNAQYALEASDRNDKVLTLGVRKNNANRVEISVRDNGIGIAPENHTRIFSHGFTTKKEGHGFGLHSGALAAREMGGALQAFSDGLGKGATFVLELPIAAENTAGKSGDNNE